jgi:HSP20 family protein
MNMALMRRQDVWDPFSELEELGNRLNRLFGVTRWGGEDRGESLAMTQWTPACDISETDKEYRIRLELPEVKKDDVRITLANGMLTVQGERKQEQEVSEARYHRRELRYGTFLTRFTLPDTIDEEKVDASYQDGILTLVIQKSEQKQQKAKQIAIH